jgi:formylglycine-generating enzyme required for sulfatase activity
MNPVPLSALLLALACGEGRIGDSGAGAEEDDWDSDTRCEASEDGPGGLVAGSQNCSGGICEVESGAFWMGMLDPNHPERCPERQVELTAFAIDQTEVTRLQYSACTEDGECTAPPEHCQSEVKGSDAEYQPVICVDWEQASAYCAWTGSRLPTEAEWEKSARGTDGAEWAWGLEPPRCTTANHRAEVSYCEVGVIEVGSYPKSISAYGLLDTVGNAWEWTQDWYDARYYGDSPDTDPPGPDEDECAETAEDERTECRFKVMRGGAFNTTQDNTRGAARSGVEPDRWDVNIGFRCAYDR